MTWQEKLAELRDALEIMVTALNKDRQYAAAAGVQEALRHVARINDLIHEIPVSEIEWTGTAEFKVIE